MDEPSHIIFLSHVLGRDTPLYGGERRIRIVPDKRLDQGDSCNTLECSFPCHAGTHIDLPRHFDSDGPTVDSYPASFWEFRHPDILRLSDCPLGCRLGPEILETCTVSPAVDLLLIRTTFGQRRGHASYWQAGPIFLPELATCLRAQFPALRAIGLDAISLSSWTDRRTGRDAHRAFLGSDRPILIIEDMDLDGLAGTEILARVVVAPLRIQDGDGVPCTVLAEVNP